MDDQNATEGSERKKGGMSVFQTLIGLILIVPLFILTFWVPFLEFTKQLSPDLYQKIMEYLPNADGPQ